MKTFKTVEAYIEAAPKAVQPRLKKLRAAIRKAATDATEGMSYGMVGYKHSGRALVYFGCFRNHIGFFALPSARAGFKAAFEKYRGSKSSLRFPHDRPIPFGLVARVVKFRVKQNRARTKK